VISTSAPHTITLSNGRKLRIADRLSDEHPDQGWYFLHIPNLSQVHFLKKQMQVPVRSVSFLSPPWFSVFLNNSQATQLSSNHSFALLPMLPTDKFSRTSYHSIHLILAHNSFRNPQNYSRLYGNYYISRTPPDLFDPAILSIDPISKPQLLNRWAAGLVQSSNARLEYSGARLMAFRPIHDRWITGSGVTVAVIDSGLGVRLCQFSGPSREIPFDRDDPQHRKVVRYDGFADRLDSVHGHGTHVCGTLAGKVQCHNCTAALYDGHAPDAKIYFVDCGNKQTPRSLIPEMRLSEVFQSAERLGCSVMSNSWGFPSHLGGAVYRVLFDEAAYRRRGMLMVFGAGNSRKRAMFTLLQARRT
jgi:hypothetical protein